jgi:hypothetical protein
MRKNKPLLCLVFFFGLCSSGIGAQAKAADKYKAPTRTRLAPKQQIPTRTRSAPPPAKAAPSKWDKYPTSMPAQDFTVVKTTRLVTYREMRAAEPLHFDLRVGTLQTDSIPMMSAAGLGLIYYPSGNWGLGFTALLANRDITDDLQKEFGSDIEVGKAPLATKSASAFTRFFWLWNFYLDTGIGIRAVDSAFELQRKDPETTYSLEMHTWTVTLDLNVGNQWNFSNGLFLGADWAGYSLPLQTGKSVEATVQNSVELDDDLPAVKALTDSLANGIADDASVRLLILYAGYSF